MKKTSKGRQKIEIKRIDDKKTRQVTFTRRRQGLFKKCAKVCSLVPGTQLAALTFSVCGEPYSFGDPSPASVINRYLANDTSNSRDNNCGNNYWWERSVDNMGLQELEEYKVALEGLKEKVLSRVDDVSWSEITTQSLGNNLDCVDSSCGDQLPVEATECLNLSNDDALLSVDENEDLVCTYEHLFGDTDE